MKHKDKKISLAIKFKGYLIALKKLFVIWLVLAIIVGIIDSVKIIATSSSNGSLSATVNFSFDGIEEGLDPSGNKFDALQIKDEDIVKSALESLSLDSSDEMITEIRNNITVDGVVPDNIISTITTYSSIFSDDGLNSFTSVSDTSYNPTQFTVNFKYTNTSMSRKEGSELLNAVLDQYKTYFYSTYGYNKSIETALLSFDYNDYDYTEAIDVIDSSLESLQLYIDSLSENDNTRFISSETGYSFSDLSEAVDTFRTEDVDWLSTYIISNNVTKDKTELINYYQYKIEDATREKTATQEQYDSIVKTIEEYEKTSTVVLGVGNDSEEYSYSQSSDTYNDLINQKVSLKTKISEADTNIDLYKQRISKLKSAKNSTANVETTENYFSDLSSKMESLLDTVNKTAAEYYEEVKLSNAYQVVSYSSSAAATGLSLILGSSHEIASYELILLGVYMFVALIIAIVEINGKTITIARKKQKGKVNAES